MREPTLNHLPVSFQQNDSFNIAPRTMMIMGTNQERSGGKGMMSAGGMDNPIGRGASTIVDLVTGGLAGDAARLGAAQITGRVPIVGTESCQQRRSQVERCYSKPQLAAAVPWCRSPSSVSFKFLARSRRERRWWKTSFTHSENSRIQNRSSWVVLVVVTSDHICLRLYESTNLQNC